jgi:hypothetical protein
MTVPFVAMVIGYRITGEKSSHDSRYGCRTTSQQKVYMIGHQGPCIADNIQPGADTSHPIKEIVSIKVILKYSFPFYTSYYYVMDCSGYINS